VVASALGWLADLPDPTHDPEQVRRTADRILARRQYKWSDQETALDRVGRWLADVLSHVTAPIGLGNVPVAAGWVVLALVVGLVAFLVYRSRGSLRGGGPPAAGPRGRVVVAAEDDDVDWAAELARAEADGRWRDALRARYRVVVGELAAAGALPDLVGRTAGELAADVRANAPAVAPAFTELTDLFEAVWYGDAPAGPGERDRGARLAADVHARLRAAPVGA